MSGEVFFDTNILLYLLSNESKADCAEKLVSGGGIISVQVLNEFASVAYRKLSMPYEDIQEILGVIRTIFRVVPMTVDTHDLGIQLAKRYGFSFYDALIVASSLQTNCTILYSEDMQDGQIINELVTIKNPF